MDIIEIIYGASAMIFAFLIAFTVTPAIRVVSYKLGAVDVPKDDRRMHNTPIPRLGGLAIFISFTAATMIFGKFTPAMTAIWLGGCIIVTLGALDDIYKLHALIKFAVQLVVALIAVWQGITIEFINLFGNYIVFGIFEIPITIIWIIGLTNAINLIDGLDGLSCGVSAICSLALLFVTLSTHGDTGVALIMGILAGSCLGFLPFNSNPAKIFMGDTGALFLGYTLAILSLDQLFKFQAVMSFLIPLSIFGFPILDTAFAIIRRALKGKNPFTTPDRGHLHHRLIDMGFNQKQSVSILYAICGILGVAALMISNEAWIKAGCIILIGLSVFIITFFIIRNSKTREQAGLGLPEIPGTNEPDLNNNKDERNGS